jgi:hypothetical protein
MGVYQTKRGTAMEAINSIQSTKSVFLVTREGEMFSKSLQPAQQRVDSKPHPQNMQVPPNVRLCTQDLTFVAAAFTRRRFFSFR